MPPVKRGGIELSVGDDGRLLHTFRQSTLSELDTCPERGRLTMTGLLPRVETDAAALGTAAHTGFEYAMHYLAEHGVPPTPDEIAGVMFADFDRLAALPEFAWKKYTKPASVYAYLESIAYEFYFGIFPTLEPLGIEIPFEQVPLYEDDERVIVLNGTIDLFDKNIGAADWKTAGDARKFKAQGDVWQLERWGVQPTVYIHALIHLGFLDPDADSWDFTYLAYALGGYGSVELLTPKVTRHKGDLEWLQQKCLSYALLVEAEVPSWPKQDNHALCSETWCPAWNTCKGAHYEQGWPKPSLPVYTQV